MDTFFDTIVTEPLKDFLGGLFGFFPRLFTGAIIIALGIVLAWFLRKALGKVGALLRIDVVCSRIGMTDAMEKVGLKASPTVLFSGILYWFVVIVFVVIGLYTLRIPAIEDLLEQFFLYVPSLFVAATLLLVGYAVANFVGRAVLIASVNAGIKSSGLMARGVNTVIVVFAVAMALEQLGIARDTVVAAFTVIFGGVVFALALAFGLGGKDLARHYLDQRFRKDTGTEQEDEIQHL